MNLIKNTCNSSENEITSIEGMPIFLCDCGVKILIVPDVPAMDRAIETHLVLHEQLTGKTLKKQELTERILSALIR
jgi:hypothetical protein